MSWVSLNYACLITCGWRGAIINLRWELQQAGQEVESASVGHADDNVGDSAVHHLVKQLVEEAHHALCSFSSITFHSGKLGGQEVVKFLYVVTEQLIKLTVLQQWQIMHDEHMLRHT